MTPLTGPPAQFDRRIGVRRPAELDAHPRALRRRCGNRRCANIRSRPCGCGRLWRGGRPAAGNARGVAEQRQRSRPAGAVGKAIGGSVLRRRVAGEQRVLPLARAAICQMPSPIITATAAATTIVGISGRRRIMVRSVLRARGAIFLGQQQRLAEAQPSQRQATPTGTHNQMHPIGRLMPQLDDDRADGHDRPDDQDEERRRPVADVERGKIEPAGCGTWARS